MTKITTCGNEIEIRKASEAEIGSIKRLFDQHKTELGFVVSSALLTSITRSELTVAVTKDAEIVGIIHYRHRKDGQTTLYNIVVSSRFRRQSIAKSLLEDLKNEARAKGQKSISLKCPAELEANAFYVATDFHLSSVINGKHRPLNVWELVL